MERLRGGQGFINGFGRDLHIRDNRGRDTTAVGGAYNNVLFTGDRGKNTFAVGGNNNNVTVRNLGRDDQVVLDGHPRDWERSFDRNDGTVSFQNRLTGNRVTVSTDNGRDDNFVLDRVRFTGAPGTAAHHLQIPGANFGNTLAQAFTQGFAQGIFAGALVQATPSPWDNMGLALNMMNQAFGMSRSYQPRQHDLVAQFWQQAFMRQAGWL